MDFIIPLIIILVSILLIAIITSFVCFMMVFYSKTRKAPREDEYDIPDGDIYEKYREEMVGWIKNARSLPYEKVEIKSHDGLTLRGRYYKCNEGGLTEILFHGYRGDSERDLSGGIERCFALKRNVLLVDHRASGRSDGHVISFGINECKDCLRWIDFAIDYLGKDAKLVITGVSMGAATVMMAAGENLPDNVVCVLADCGYSTAREIICKVMDDMRLPKKLLYPFIRLGAVVFGGFDPDSNSPAEAMERAKVPVIFIHGDTDDFVPCDMSRRMYEKCASHYKKFVVINKAGHGLAYPVDKEKYINSLRDFRDECGF